MAQTIPRPRWREKNVLDIPFYRPGHNASYTRNGTPGFATCAMAILRQLTEAQLPETDMAVNFLSKLVILTAESPGR